MSAYDDRPERELHGGALGGVMFAATVLIIIGTFQLITGLVAIFDDDFFVVAQNYTFDLDTTAWGFVHLVIGGVMVATGYGLFVGSGWANAAAIVFASVSAVIQFFFIPYYPFWAILVIALDIWVIWSLTRPGAVRT